MFFLSCRTIRFATATVPIWFPKDSIRVCSDRVVLSAESEAEVDGRTASLLVGMPDVHACFARPFLQPPDDGVAHSVLVVRYDHNL